MLDKYLNQIIVGDCLELFSKIPDNSIDMTFADPPFNLNKKYNHYSDSKEKQDYLDWCNIWIHEMFRVTKTSGAIFVHNIPRWLTYYADILNEIAYFRHWIAWDSGGAPLGKTLLPNHYGILYYTKSINFSDIKFYDIRAPHQKCRICKSFIKDYGGKKAQAHGFGPLVSDVWSDIHRIRHKSRRDDHPCQLPIPLLERLILMVTDENDIVLDPFMGTGTTAIAAKRLGRQFIGFEIDREYGLIAEKNLELVSPVKVNNVFVSEYLGGIRTIRDKDYKTILNIQNSSNTLFDH